MKIFISWVGQTDYDGKDRVTPYKIVKDKEENKKNYPGHIATVLTNTNAEKYDKIYLLNNYKEKKDEDLSSYKNWIKSLCPYFCSSSIDIRNIPLTSPTSHKEIYPKVKEIIENIKKEHKDPEFTFQISSGTSAMALTWFILSPDYGAKLIESSSVAGAQKVELPFEISAYYLTDSKISEMTEAKSPPDPAFEDIIHSCDSMRSAIDKAEHVAPRNISVLIEGESGTGKELFAKAIHKKSARAKKEFIAINCGAIQQDILESELFGYKKGAFTGANNNKDGYFKEAEGGTLFLDEIGEMPLKTQIALLRVLQEKEIIPVGSSKAEKIDVRIIAATNRNLLEEVEKGNFREDLFYRLAIAYIEIPALKERGKDDIELLIADALKKANKDLEIKKEEHKFFSKNIKNIMFSHSWKGNVRELYNTVMRAVLWSTGHEISEKDIKQALFKPRKQEENIQNVWIEEGFNLKEHLKCIEKEYFEKAWEQSGHHQANASILLGISNYQTFANKAEKHGMMVKK